MTNFTNIKDLEANLAYVALEMEKLFQGDCRIHVHIHDAEAYTAADIQHPTSEWLFKENKEHKWCVKEVSPQISIVLFKRLEA